MSEYKPWKPNTFYNKGEIFQFTETTYKVIEDFLSDNVFKPNDSRIRVYNKSSSGSIEYAEAHLNEDGTITVDKDSTETVVLQVNGIAYFNIGSNPAFSISDGKLIWDEDATGFALDSSDVLILG